MGKQNSIAVECERCENTFMIRDDYAGKTIKCPKCGGAVEVPEVKSDPDGAKPVRGKAHGRKKSGKDDGGRPALVFAGLVVLVVVIGAYVLMSGRSAPAPTGARPTVKTETDGTVAKEAEDDFSNETKPVNIDPVNHQLYRELAASLDFDTGASPLAIIEATLGAEKIAEIRRPSVGFLPRQKIDPELVRMLRKAMISDTVSLAKFTAWRDGFGEKVVLKESDLKVFAEVSGDGKGHADYAALRKVCDRLQKSNGELREIWAVFSGFPKNLEDKTAVQKRLREKKAPAKLVTLVAKQLKALDTLRSATQADRDVYALLMKTNDFNRQIKNYEAGITQVKGFYTEAGLDRDGAVDALSVWETMAKQGLSGPEAVRGRMAGGIKRAKGGMLEMRKMLTAHPYWAPVPLSAGDRKKLDAPDTPVSEKIELINRPETYPNPLPEEIFGTAELDGMEALVPALTYRIAAQAELADKKVKACARIDEALGVVLEQYSEVVYEIFAALDGELDYADVRAIWRKKMEILEKAHDQIRRGEFVGRFAVFRDYVRKGLWDDAVNAYLDLGGALDGLPPAPEHAASYARSGIALREMLRARLGADGIRNQRAREVYLDLVYAELPQPNRQVFRQAVGEEYYRVFTTPATDTHKPARVDLTPIREIRASMPLSFSRRRVEGLASTAGDDWERKTLANAGLAGALIFEREYSEVAKLLEDIAAADGGDIDALTLAFNLQRRRLFTESLISSRVKRIADEMRRKAELAVRMLRDTGTYYGPVPAEYREAVARDCWHELPENLFDEKEIGAFEKRAADVLKKLLAPAEKAFRTHENLRIVEGDFRRVVNNYTPAALDEMKNRQGKFDDPLLENIYSDRMKILLRAEKELNANYFRLLHIRLARAVRDEKIDAVETIMHEISERRLPLPPLARYDMKVIQNLFYTVRRIK